VNTQPIDNGLDRQNIATLRQRFLAINDDRLERMRGALSDRHQIFMDALPLLLHSNHPMMPGFVSRQTPARISDYKPSKKDILVGKSIAKSFTIAYEPNVHDDIYGIYIMGSVGTIAQSEGSDLDIWVCCRPNIGTKALTELELKCKKISLWAEQHRLEVHFFLMDHEAFKAGKLAALNSESSGSAQRLLLLDEFYRTAIFIAGRVPLWWFVPAPDESYFKEYANTLLFKRFLPDESVLDFGGIAEIPAGEFLGAGIWQLYKAIESPYKSVLKLLLLETYVADYPDIVPLSLTYKGLIYDGEFDIDMLDSYVMIYQRIEHYLLANEQHKRLELARRCFYFKVAKPLSKPPAKHAKSWQRRLLEAMTEHWGWSDEYLRFLDSRAGWKAPEVATERGLLETELNHSYRFLTSFANTSGASRTISPEELIVLGRKLQAAFERRPGKVELVNPSISSDISESVLRISTVTNNDNDTPIWTAFSHEAGTTISGDGVAVKSSLNPVELLLWCYYNGVITEYTSVDLNDSSTLDQAEVNMLLGSFRAWLPLPLSAAKHADYQRSASAKNVLFLVNAGKVPASNLDEQGFERMSDRSDALSYGGFEQNLVSSVDVLVRNNWNEITIRHFSGENALLDAASEYLQLALPGTHQTPPDIDVACIDRSHTATITRRVEQWLEALTQCFFSGANPTHKRFVFQIANNHYCMQFKGMKPTFNSFRNVNHMITHLEHEQKHFSPVIMDPQALAKHPLRAVTRTSHAKTIDIFFRRFDIGTEIYIVDERGSILHTLIRGRNTFNPLKPLYRFLRAVLNRQAQFDASFEGDFGIFPIHFYELVKNQDGYYLAKPRNLSADSPSAYEFEVKVVAHLDAEQRVRYDYYCDDQVFSSSNDEKHIEHAVSKHILSRRTRDKHYPIFITDLDLHLAADAISQTGHLQTIHYLRIKNRLEFQLNRATGTLLNA